MNKSLYVKTLALAITASFLVMAGNGLGNNGQSDKILQMQDFSSIQLDSTPNKVKLADRGDKILNLVPPVNGPDSTVFQEGFEAEAVGDLPNEPPWLSTESVGSDYGNWGPDDFEDDVLGENPDAPWQTVDGATSISYYHRDFEDCTIPNLIDGGYIADQGAYFGMSGDATNVAAAPPAGTVPGTIWAGQTTGSVCMRFNEGTDTNVQSLVGPYTGPLEDHLYSGGWFACPSAIASSTLLYYLYQDGYGAAIIVAFNNGNLYYINSAMTLVQIAGCTYIQNAWHEMYVEYTESTKTYNVWWDGVQRATGLAYTDDTATIDAYIMLGGESQTGASFYPCDFCIDNWNVMIPPAGGAHVVEVSNAWSFSGSGGVQSVYLDQNNYAGGQASTSIELPAPYAFGGFSGLSWAVQTSTSVANTNGATFLIQDYNGRTLMALRFSGGQIQYNHGGTWTNLMAFAANTEYWIDMYMDCLAKTYMGIDIDYTPYLAGGEALVNQGAGIAGFRVEGTLSTQSEIYFDDIERWGDIQDGTVRVSDIEAHSGSQSVRMWEAGGDTACDMAAYMGGDLAAYGEFWFWFFGDGTLGGGEVQIYDTTGSFIVTIISIGGDPFSGPGNPQPGQVVWLDGLGDLSAYPIDGPIITPNTWNNISIRYDINTYSFEARWNGVLQGTFGFLENGGVDAGIVYFGGEGPAAPCDWYFDDIGLWVDDIPATPLNLHVVMPPPMPSTEAWYTVNQDNAVEGTVTNTYTNVDEITPLDGLTEDIQEAAGGSGGIPVVEGSQVSGSAVASATLTLTAPGGITSGELLILLAMNEDNTGTAQFSNNLAGWNFGGDIGNVNSAVHMGVFWRIADGTEGASVAVTAQSSDQWMGFYLRISGADTTAPINAATPGTIASGDPINVPGVTTTVNNCLAFYALAFDGGDGDPFSVGAPWTEGGDAGYGTANAGVAGTWGTRGMATAGATGAVSVNCAVADGASYLQFAIAPAVAAPSLEHRWRTENVPAGADVMKLQVTARTSAGADDSFTFGYSTVIGGPYSGVITVNSATMATYYALIPTSLTGQFYINVVDSSSADAAADTIFIDAITIYWQQIIGITPATEVATADNPNLGTVVGTFAMTVPPADATAQQITEVAGGGAATLLTEGFEGGVVPPAGWISIDQDGDGHNWMIGTAPGQPAHTGTYSAMSESWNGAPYTPDNYLISPMMDMSAWSGGTLTWWDAAQDPAYAGEHYLVKVSTTGTAVGDFTATIADITLTVSTYTLRTASLNAFGGQQIYIAWEHCLVTDMYQMKIDDVQVDVSAAGNYINHVWTMQNMPADSMSRTLSITARTSAGADDAFNIGWSQNLAGPYTNVISVNTAAYQTYNFAMSPDFTGPMYIRATDANPADATIDTLFIDALWINDLISPVNTTVNVLWDLSTDDGAGANDVTQYNVYFSDSEVSGTSDGPFYYLGSAPAGTNIYRHYGEADDFIDNIWYVVTAQDSHSEGFSTGRATKFNVAPDTQNVLVDGTTSVEVVAGTLVTLTADIYDDSSTWEDILKMDLPEWYADVDPGEGMGTPMIGDGLWDSTLESFMASIDTTGWTVGTHQIFVRGYEFGPGNTGSGWGPVSVAVLINITGGPTPYNIDLAGIFADQWVFVSFPVEVTGNIQDVLNDATLGDGQTTWDVAKWQDAQDTADPWKTYRFGSTINDMPILTNQMGVWVHLTLNGGDTMLTLGVTGSIPAAAVIINLYTGWNLVGYPSMSNAMGDATLPGQADYVSTWTATNPYIVDQAPGAVMLSHGHGYWVHVTADCVWTVNP